jgi:uncharacterized protein YecE (DUF72 family)
MILVGTSGYNYPEWKGSFYPSDLPAAKMLPYYASKFPTVEINYTFYRMPTPKLIAGWRAQVPPEFRFTLKAPKRITHDKRLRAGEVAESVSGFLTAASELGPQLAALLFQLPPNLKKDLGLLNEFLALLPPKTTAAFEFRNASWLEDDVFEALRARKIAQWTATAKQLSERATDVFVYFKHEDEGKGAAFGQQMMTLLGQNS